MLSNKKKWTFIWMTIIFSLLSIKMGFYTEVSPKFDVFIIATFLIALWDLFLNYRRFYATRSMLLEECVACDCVDYAYYKSAQSNRVSRIWVTIPNVTKEWFELDYRLAIPRFSPMEDFEELKKNATTCRGLVDLMNDNAKKTASSDNYDNFKRKYNTIRYTSLILIIIGFLVAMGVVKSNEKPNFYQNDYYERSYDY